MRSQRPRLSGTALREDCSVKSLILRDHRCDVESPDCGIANGASIQRNGGSNGSLLITLRLRSDARYARTGDDLTQDVPVSIYKALLGGEQTVQTLSGPVKITLKPETQNGTRLRLRGKGFPVYKKPGEFGDLYLRLTLALPQHLTPQEKELIQQLAALRPAGTDPTA